MRVSINICSIFHFPPSCFRSWTGPLYGGVLTQLGGLTHLCEISTYLKNFYKNMCSYEKWASLSWGISIDFFPGFHLGEMNIFHMNTHGLASLAKWGRVFCNEHVYILFSNSFQIWFQHGCYKYHHDHSWENNKRQPL